MKKILLGTTAMMTAGLVATGAQAAEWEVGLSGYYTGMAVFADEDPTPNPDIEDVQFKQEGELAIDPSIMLDNGLKIGASFNLELTNNDGTKNGGNTFDETFLYVEGSFGRVELGENGSAPFQMHISAPYFVGSHGVDSPNFQHARRIGAARTSSYITISGDTAKLTYFSPNFSGFQLGVSYTPERLNGDVGGQATGSKGAAFGLIQSAVDHFEDTIEIGATYAGEFEGVSVGVSGGYATADVTDGSGAGLDDPEAWSAGLSLGAAGFTLAGGYYSSDDLIGFAAANTDNEEKAYSVGLQYETGPWRVGVAYFNAERDFSGVAGSVNAEFEVVELGVNKNLGSGVDVFAVVELYEDDANGSAAGQERETDAFGIGLDLAF
ncbi:MAG: porin [Alphaproteobacteria bacterium]